MGDKEARGNAENARYPNPPSVTTRDGFESPHGDAENFGRHVFKCSYCEIDEYDYTKDRWCPEGVRLRDRVLMTPENKAYLLRMADEWATDAWLKEQEQGFEPYTTYELLVREQAFQKAKLS